MVFQDLKHLQVSRTAPETETEFQYRLVEVMNRSGPVLAEVMNVLMSGAGRPAREVMNELMNDSFFLVSLFQSSVGALVQALAGGALRRNCPLRQGSPGPFKAPRKQKNSSALVS